MWKTVALIPAHNEVLTVRKIVDQAAHFVDRVIVVDDGSTDGTSQSLEGADCIVLRGEENLGKGHRLVEGFDHAFSLGAEVVVTLDADQQHDPNDIPAFLSAHVGRPDALILGDRSGDMENMIPYRRKGIKFGNFFIGWACNQAIKDAQCGMRAYPRSFWRKVKVPEKYTTGFMYETSALMYAAKEGMRFFYVPVKARYEGYVLRPSHFDPVRDFLRLFGLVTGFLTRNRFCVAGFFRAVGLTSLPLNQLE